MIPHLLDRALKTSILTCALGASLGFALQAESTSKPAIGTDNQDHRMDWWRQARFGMFIHWGVYSVPAGYYQGKAVPGIGEWIMCNGKIPMAEYQKFAPEFDPVNFNAEEWVKIAKAAGQKYIVITAKHHDGFAMFDSKANPWNICQATPFKRDPLKELAAACRKEGIKLGFYYSQAQDWNNGGAASHGKWDPAQEHDMDQYLDQTVLPQVRELLTNYGPDIPAVIWWDTPHDMTKERAEKIYKLVHELRPDIIENNRLGGGFKGDTETPEQFIPPQGYPGRDWETCMTMNNTWGFKKDDNNWKSSETLIRNLCDIASKGGNYLLNVGPSDKGQIPEASVERLRAVGDWLKVNGEAIYGTQPTPFGAEAGSYSATEKDKKGNPKFLPAWKWRCTTKPGMLYVHIFEWPKDGKFTVPVTNKISAAHLLSAPATKLKVTASAVGAQLNLPATAPDPTASVVALAIEGQPHPLPDALPAPMPGSTDLKK